MDATTNLFQNTQAVDWAATGAKALGQVSKGIADNKQAGYQAKQLDANSKASKAKASRSAEEERRRGEIILSNARAAMGANGGSTTDAGAIQNLAEIKQTVDYNSLAELYEGDNQAAAYTQQADAKRYAGSNARTAGFSGGVSSILQKYNKNRAR